MKRFSKKRESIIELLKGTKEHPSAEWVYEKLKPVYPKLSLATVYRNLNQLVQRGEIRSLGVINDKERFDYQTAPHTHAICVKCGKVIDVMEVKLSEDLVSEAKRITNFDINYSDLQFYGICDKCKKKER